ncbi:GntR family transcriptional regulator [uncultured Amaricoccus sp.]|uniref:GntR family transcriptional regulator n=1 Tax=uncultured Amaricoccus sp. TaxID=339341 RepID=UPI002633EF42|nr:GntR family transcriptional regulator [uncultured Amaricoccus sp.]
MIKPTAKHAAIHADLLARITSGAWPPGTAIPREAELAREFDCTRPTVARALAALVEAGLIERRRRAGSRVVERRAREALLRIPLIREEIEATGRAYGYHRLSRRRGTPPSAIRALLGPGPALRVTCLHSADGRPYQLEDRWISLATAPGAEAETFLDAGPNDWLVRTVPFSVAEHSLSAAAANEVEAEALAIPVGAPVFVIERATWLDGAAVTFARLTHPGAGFRLLTRDVGPA